MLINRTPRERGGRALRSGGKQTGAMQHYASLDDPTETNALRLYYNLARWQVEILAATLPLWLIHECDNAVE